jgi:hypothetical protein
MKSISNVANLSRKLGAKLGLYGLWAVLAALWAVAAFEVQALLLYLGIFIVEHPALRPSGWNTTTLSALNRCGLVILGAAWIGLVIFSERYLRDGLEEGRLRSRLVRLVLVIGGIYGASLGLIYLLSLI